MFEADQRDIRRSLLSLYEEQIFDNLVRIKQGRAIVHLDYTKLTGGVVHKTGASLGLGGTNNARGDTVSLGGTFSQDTSINVVAEPVTENNDVYEAYLRFARDDDLMRKTREAPGIPWIRYRLEDGFHYWIPHTAADAYLELALVTTVMRKSIDSVAFKVRVKAREHTRDTLPGGSVQHTVAITFSPKIPNDGGTASIEVEGFGKFQVLVLETDTVGFGEGTDTLRLRFMENQVAPSDAFLKSIANQQIAITLDHYRPEKSIRQLTDDITNVLEEIRINELNRR